MAIKLKRQKSARKRQISHGVILSFLLRLCRAVGTAAKKSFLARIFGGYFSLCDAYERSLIRRLLSRLDLRERVLLPLRKKTSRAFERSSVLHFLSRQAEKILSYPLRNIGVFLLSCGVYSVIVYFLKEYAIPGTSSDLLTLYMGLVLPLISLFFFLSRKSVSAAVCDSRILSFFVFRVIGKPRHKITRHEAEQRSVSTPLFFGMLFGFVSFFVHPALLFSVLTVLYVAGEILCTPEFGLLLFVFFLPFFTVRATVVLVFVTICSYLIKLLRGKRTLQIKLLDFFVLLFGVLLLFGGFISVSRASAPEAILLFMFLFAYLLFANLLRWKELLSKIVSALGAASFFVSMLTIAERLFAAFSNKADAALSGRLALPALLTDTPEIVSAYLLLALPFSIFSLLSAKTFGDRFRFSMIAVAGAGALALTGTRAVWAAILLSLFLTLLFYHRNFILVVLLGAAPCVLGATLLPQNILSRLFYTESADRLPLWRTTTEMLQKNFFGGVGVGSEAYRLSCLQYALPGMQTMPHSRSLYLQLLSSLGLPGLLVFILAMFFFVQMIFSALIHARENGHHTLCFASLCAVLGILLLGFVEYPFYSAKVFLLFFAALGIGAAAVRCAEEEERGADETERYYAG